MKTDDMTQAHSEFIAASRAQRAAYVAWQNASRDQVAPALAAYVEATRRQREIERRQTR